MKEKVLVKFIAGLKKGEVIVARAGSNSMHPIIKVGQEVKITRIPFRKVKVGDVIAYALGKRDRVIVHRVIKKSKITGLTFFKTKGDNLKEQDIYKIEKTHFIGIVDF